MKLTCRDCDKYLECKFNGRKGSSQICKDFTNKIKMIRELKMIKEEVKPLPITDTAIKLVLDILDNHISDLKGE